MCRNHKVEEAEIYKCMYCGKLTVHEIVRNKKGLIMDIRCVLCSIPR